jgi:hypothetical protein
MDRELYRKHKIAVHFAELALLFGVSPHSIVAGLMIAADRITSDDINQYGTITAKDLAKISIKIDENDHIPKATN